MTRSLSASRDARGQEVAGRVRIPADVDRPDVVMAGLTARQLAILALAAVLVWGIWAGLHRLLPLPALGTVAAPVAGGGVVLAVGHRDGVSADRLLLSALRFWRAPRRLVTADASAASSGRFCGDGGELLAPLPLPVEEVSDEGVLDLGGDGAAVVCRASAVTFALRTPGEQQGLVAGFGRWLNSLSDPVQVLVRSTPADLRPAVAELRRAAPGLPHPALEAAAVEHAGFLTDLAETRGLLSRDVLVVLRQPPPAPGPKTPDSRVAASATGLREALWRRAEEATDALSACGVTLTVLDRDAVWEVLADSTNPGRHDRPVGLGGPDAVVTTGHEVVLR